MLRFFLRLQNSIAFALFLAAFAVNQAFGPSPLLGGILLVWGVSLAATVIGKYVVPQEHPSLQRWLGAWVFLSLLMVEGAAAYYLFPFTPTVAAILIAVAILPCLLLCKTPPHSWRDRFAHAHDAIRSHAHRVPRSTWFAIVGILFFFYIAFDLLRTYPTIDPVRSLWLVVPPAIFLAFGCGFLLFAAFLLRGQERSLALPLTCLALGLCLLIPAIVFPLGYGFDPFIHRATVSYIADHGTITPKPPYYAGQYGLELILHLGFGLPVGLVDTLLVPLLAALFLPFAWYGAAQHLLSDKRLAAGSLLLLFLLPWSVFTVTTPQSLANLWMLLLVLSAIPYLARVERPRPLVLILPTLAILATHPIAGLPALLFLVLTLSEPARTNLNLAQPARALYWAAALLGGISLPLAFAFNRWHTGNGLGLDLSGLAPTHLWEALHLNLFFQNQFNPLLDFVYLFGDNATLLLLVVALFGWVRAKRNQFFALRAVAVAAICVGVNYLLLATAVDFSFLISYERENYAARLVPLFLFFLSPFLILAFGSFLARIRTGPLMLRTACVALLAALLTTNVYLAFPRHDGYTVGRGFNTSATDTAAVERIANDAKDDAYIVLANQSVSAAALQTLGFFRYYGDQFAYPVPTGNPLYARFLAMNESPSRATALEAAALAEVSCNAAQACQKSSIVHVYYVVNSYWWQADRLRETAKTNADAWWALGEGDGSVAVFRYDL